MHCETPSEELQAGGRRRTGASAGRRCGRSRAPAARRPGGRSRPCAARLAQRTVGAPRPGARWRRLTWRRRGAPPPDLLALPAAWPAAHPRRRRAHQGRGCRRAAWRCGGAPQCARAQPWALAGLLWPWPSRPAAAAAWQHRLSLQPLQVCQGGLHRAPPRPLQRRAAGAWPAAAPQRPRPTLASADPRCGRGLGCPPVRARALTGSRVSYRLLRPRARACAGPRPMPGHPLPGLRQLQGLPACARRPTRHQRLRCRPCPPQVRRQLRLAAAPLPSGARRGPRAQLAPDQAAPRQPSADPRERRLRRPLAARWTWRAGGPASQARPCLPPCCLPCLLRLRRLRAPLLRQRPRHRPRRHQQRPLAARWRPHRRLLHWCRPRRGGWLAARLRRLAAPGCAPSTLSHQFFTQTQVCCTASCWCAWLFCAKHRPVIFADPTRLLAGAHRWACWSPAARG